MYGKDDLIGPHGGYRKLRRFQAAQEVYDGTTIFCERFIDRGSPVSGKRIEHVVYRTSMKTCTIRVFCGFARIPDII